MIWTFRFRRSDHAFADARRRGTFDRAFGEQFVDARILPAEELAEDLSRVLPERRRRPHRIIGLLAHEPDRRADCLDLARRRVLPVCRARGIAVVPWSPLAGGLLSGRYTKCGDPSPSVRAQRRPQRFDISLPENQPKLRAARRLGELAEEAGMTLIQLAIAFAMSHTAVTAPIIGPRTFQQLEAHLDALDVTLSDELLDRVDEIVAPGTTLATPRTGTKCRRACQFAPAVCLAADRRGGA